MEIYTTIMTILSLLGILTLVLSIYIFTVVPTKMSAMFRAAIIGNFLSSCSFQIFLSMGTIPSVLLPCCAIHVKGLMNYTGMSTLGQMYLVLGIYGFAGWFLILICLMRAVAISVYLTERRKKQIPFIYAFGSILNPIMLTTMADKLKISENDRLSCIEMFNNKPPPELFMSETLVVNIKDDSALVFIVYYCICCISIYSIIGSVSTGYLIWTLRMHRTQSSSSQTMESQHKMTMDVLKMASFQIMCIIVPPMAILFCILTSIPYGIASKILFILWVISVNIACILMIRLIPAYKERLSKICLSILPAELIKWITKSKLQTMSVQSGVVRSSS